jgi:hypothetical protein
MDKRAIQLEFVVVALGMCTAAQTVTGGGTTNTVPVSTGSLTIGNLPIRVSCSHVGIGATGTASLADS